MTRNTGLLTERCDPYGIESTVKLAGGLYPQSMMGKHIWYCQNTAQARYRLICTGGTYGFRRANDGAPVPAYECPGGHQGVVMPLCSTHARELAVGPPKPGWNRDRTVPHGQVGGTKANELCPKCAVPTPEVKDMMDHADALQQYLSRLQTAPVALLAQIADAERQLNDVRARIDELAEQGFIHRCPLKLVEVS